ncbi:hypothetical protein [Natronomonas sp.]|uniref:hypothetical protein n=1 Tax=Natronomonas sp. TaxID=2184060 RepID=UPI00263245B4|nr:hypothetical protein [Natronomonas sp.]
MTQNNAGAGDDEGGTTAADLPKYLAVAVNPDKDPEAMDTYERRSEIGDFVLQAGSAERLNYSELARRYDVAPSTVKRDVDAIADDLAKHLAYRVELNTMAIHRRAVNGLLDAEEFYDAWRVQKEFSEWLEDRGTLERAPDRVNTEVTQHETDTTTDSYTVMSDEQADRFESDDCGRSE